MLQMVTQLKAPRYDTKKDPFDKSLHNSISTLLDLTKLDHQALVDFFIQHWATDEMVPFIGNSQVFINFKECHSYMVYNNKVLLNIDDNKDSNIWIFTGTGNKQRYIDLTKFYEYLGPSLCRSLPGFHTLTGCGSDYNPAFFKKGKQRPFNILKKKY
uniref:SFRICE_026934 n=1 Tax=Spodoptera frugiperda TaxID=7108 RepID=A0A2H1VK22_SPOFR